MDANYMRGVASSVNAIRQYENEKPLHERLKKLILQEANDGKYVLNYSITPSDRHVDISEAKRVLKEAEFVVEVHRSQIEGEQGTIIVKWY